MNFYQNAESQINQLFSGIFDLKIKFAEEDDKTEIQIINEKGKIIQNPSSGQQFIIDLILKAVINQYNNINTINLLVIDESL